MKNETQYYFLGMYVSKKIHDRYCSCTYPFMGRIVDISAVYMFATDENIKELLPEYYIEANKIIHGVKSEINRLKKRRISTRRVNIPIELAELLYEESVLANRVASGIKAAKKWINLAWFMTHTTFVSKP